MMDSGYQVVRDGGRDTKETEGRRMADGTLGDREDMGEESFTTERQPTEWNVHGTKE